MNQDNTLDLKALQEKWDATLNGDTFAPIESVERRRVVAQLLENQQAHIDIAPSQLNEAVPTNSTGANIANSDPVLISMVRRAMPNLMAYDVASVQPMSGPTGLIFAMKSHYTNQTGTEALFDEADTDFSGTGVHAGNDPFGAYTTGTAMTTAAAEDLGRGTAFAQMAFSIDKTTVTAKSRGLKAEYSHELQQDLKAIHGLDAGEELANILSTEILAEMNREIIRTVYTAAKVGAANTSVAGTFNLDVDSNGRWLVEKGLGLFFGIETEANAIAKETRRGRGNVIITSSDVASLLDTAGKLSNNGTSLAVDDTSNTFVGTTSKGHKVFIDPYYIPAVAGENFAVVGYKGSSSYDAGLFYCPYVPLERFNSVGEEDFAPRIGFKTRYGIVSNPFTSIASGQNVYYRKFKVTNIQ